MCSLSARFAHKTGLNLLPAYSLGCLRVISDVGQLLPVLSTNVVLKAQGRGVQDGNITGITVNNGAERAETVRKQA